MRTGFIVGGLIVGLSCALGVVWGDDPAASPEAIDALVARLDDSAYATREDAHAKLVAIGAPALERLRTAERVATSLEVKRRLAAIIRSIASVRWRENDLQGALDRAKTDRKPLLVFSTIGGVKGYA